MRDNINISAVISAFNEEDKIKDCLESVKWVDEIIFVDSGSLDKTSEIAKNYTTKIYKRPNNLMLNVNKNYGFTKALGDWILCLDADERVSEELAKEIGNCLPAGEAGKLEIGNSRVNGYWIPRKNIIFGKWIKHTGWYPDYQLRLFRNGKGRFPEEHVHEMIKLNGETRKLSEHLVHYNYDTISEFIQKLDTIYAPNEAEQLLKEGYVFTWKDSIHFPMNEFLSRFFAREGYKDGFHGFMLSIMMAFYHFIVFAKIWEKEKFKDTDLKNLIGETEKEIDNVNKKIKLWYLSENIKNIKNPIKKNIYRLLKKFI